MAVGAVPLQFFLSLDCLLLEVGSLLVLADAAGQRELARVERVVIHVEKRAVGRILCLALACAQI